MGARPPLKPRRVACRPATLLAGVGSNATLIAWIKRRAAAEYGAAVVGKTVWVSARLLAMCLYALGGLGSNGGKGWRARVGA